ncbi:MAG TPA: alpha-amylase family glycosyl hydrolase, partial [Steroidobacteraceae bacterium]|nr:alpha-amylase family glycosyl hydrolase [Steroidobacteraceae bacterium]
MLGADSGPGGRAGAVIPRATYRLQLNADFTFRDATALVPYLDSLGISHVYCSPYFRSRPGSKHGYDVVDHNSLDPEIGTREEFEQFVATLRAHGMGHILDFVPNHVGIMGADNAWWMDVLENGKASRYADFFDIDWAPPSPGLAGKLLVPALGRPYGSILESGELQLRYEAASGSLAVFYHDHRFPIDPRSYPVVLEKALARIPAHGTTGSPTAAAASAGHDAEVSGDARREFESLISAFHNLPERGASSNEQFLERDRDKDIHKKRLGALIKDTPGLAAAIESAVAEISG